MTVVDTAAIGCPSCGAALEFREGGRTVRCAACGSHLAVSGEAGIARYYLPEQLDLAKARSAARRFLATRGVDARLVETLHFEGGELLFLPFWRLLGQGIGWHWYERRTEVEEEVVDEEGNSRLVQRPGPLERNFEPLAVPIDVSTPACDTSPYGLRGIATVASVLPLKGMQFEKLAERGTVVDPLKGYEQVRREALAMARDRRQPPGVLQSRGDLRLVAARAALISYPVWRLSFRAGERLYPLVVDGVNGNVLKARLPAAATIRVQWPLAAVTAIVFAFSVHQALGAVVLAGILLAVLAQGDFSPAALLAFFGQLVQRGAEVEHG